MDELQIYRELVQNGFEAGASEIILDGWTDPETDYTLARVSDNGSGMTHTQLIDHLSMLHVRTKGNGNYGVGARIAGVARNPAGMTFASKTKSGEGLIRIVKHGGEYVVQEWSVEIDGYEQLVEFVDPDQGELAKVPKTKTGTAVIMHGNGKKEHLGLRRSRTRPPSSWPRGTSASPARRRSGLPIRTTLAACGPSGSSPSGISSREQSSAGGEISFKNVGGLDGFIFWWVLPKYDVLKDKIAGAEPAQRRRRGGSRERDLRLLHLELGRLRADLQLGREESRDPRLDRRCDDGHRQVRDRASR